MRHPLTPHGAHTLTPHVLPPLTPHGTPTWQYKRVLTIDASNVEAIACLAANHFYSDQPELALRFYRRLLQVDAAPPQACLRPRPSTALL